MRIIILSILFSYSLQLLAQTDSNTSERTPYEWPYSMPIWGKKAAERGYKIQLPYGLNVNYVYNRMDLEIFQFDMSIGNDPNSNINKLIDEYINEENLGFTNTIGKTNGMNLRADVWVFPFLNVYGIYANSTGNTEVSLQPTWYDQDGNLVLSLGEVTSRVDFDANTFGFGSTVVGKIYDNYFFSVDGNLSWSYSELLDDPAQLMVVSARVGDRIQLGKESFLAVYVGGMYRGFVDQRGNFGQIGIQEALPNLGSELLPAIDERISDNNEKISQLDPNKPLEQKQIEILQRKNQILREIETSVEGILGSNVNYNIQKDIINNWSVQFGFNLEINQSLTIRGEFGKGNGNDFVLTGVQYRFGL